MAQLNAKIVLRNDIYTAWESSNPVLLKGEIGVEYNPAAPTAEGQLDYQIKIKIGDGVNKWNDLPYFGGDSTVIEEITAAIEDITKDITEISNSLGNDESEGTVIYRIGHLEERVEALEGELANKANSADVYTKEEADNAIASAVANAEHLKRVIISQEVLDEYLAEPSKAQKNVIYMVKTETLVKDSYQEFMRFDSESGAVSFEQIGDTSVSLADYATTEYVDKEIETVEGAIALKADQSALNAANEEIAKKANSETVNSALEAKANSKDVYSKGDVYNKTEIDNALDLKFYNGKLYITVNGVRKGNGVTVGTAFYDVVLNMTNCVSSNDSAIVEEHSEYTTVISAKTGFVMNQLAVTMAGVPLSPDNGEIHISDVTGEIQITAAAVETAGSIDVSGIVEWYQDEVIEGYNYVKELSNSDSNWVHHVVLTDTHFAHNAGNSVPICNALLDTGWFDKFIHLGDLLETPSEINWQAALDSGLAQHADKMLFCIGNHDDEGTEVTNQTYYDALVAPNTALVMGSEDITNLYYYCDDHLHKIRYIVLNSMLLTDTNTAMNTWMDERVAELDSEWVYFILEHYPSYKAYSNWDVKQRGPFLSTQSLLVEAQFGGHISGHVHQDYVGQSDFYNQQTYLMDRLLFNESAFPEGTVSVREEGTASEHAITILSINPATKEVRSYRIGAYDDGYQRMSYNYGAFNDTMYIDGYYLGASSYGYVCSQEGFFDTLSKEVYDAESDDYTNVYFWVYRNNHDAVPFSKLFLGGYSERKLTSWIRRKAITYADSRINKAFDYTALVQPTGRYMLMAFEGNDYTDLENYTITKDVYAPEVPYCADLWESGFLSAYNIVDDPGSYGTTFVTARAISCKPSTTYRLSNTAENWNLTYIRCAQFSGYNASMTVAVAPSGIASGSSYTFTTKADTKYIIIAFGTDSDDPCLDTMVFEEVTE